MKPKPHSNPDASVVKSLMELNEKKDFNNLEKRIDEQLSLFPNSSLLHNLKGTALSNLNRLEEGIDSFNLALDNAENPEIIFNNLGVTQIKLNRAEDSIKNFNHAIESNPKYYQAHFNAATAYRKIGKMHEAINSYNLALEIHPEYAKGLVYKSLTLKNLGNFEESISAGKEALRVQPNYGLAHRHLSTMLSYSNANNTHISQMESAYEEESTSQEDRMHIAFGLGKAYEDLKQYEKAFSFLQEGNRIHRSTLKYSTKGREKSVSILKENFNKNFFDNYNSLSTQGEKVIFIIGMPRSGTSLVEQIISSHSKVYGAGELRFMKEVVDFGIPPKDGKDYPTNITLHDPKVFDIVGLNYLKLLEKLGKDKGRLVIDKMPYNFLYVGVISCALPKAKIILCERNPLDNCFSIYKQKFGVGNDYAYSLKEIGEYYNLYSDLIKHWRSVLPNKMLSVSYEDIISNQEQISKSMIDFCGLDWEEECLSFHSNKREVHTASAVQVRKPIYRTSVKLSEKYGENLSPLIKELNKGEDK
jgi:tetratricopeptide (TPR) repeat protein